VVLGSVSTTPATQDHLLEDNHDNEDLFVTILSKPSAIQLGIFKARRPIARAQTVSLGTTFHNQDIPQSHVILFYRGLVSTETIAPIPGGQLDYIDPDDNQINIAKLHIGQPFHWPTDLVSHDLPPDYQADLQAPLEGPEAGDFDEYDNGSDDTVTCNTRKALNQSRKSMAKRYSKHHEIDEFVAGDIIALKLPKGARTTGSCAGPGKREAYFANAPV
jgi:hypothetical protein